MRKIAKILTAATFAAALALSMAPVSNAYTTIAPTGSGTEESPYLIGSLAELAWLLDNTAAWSKHSKLTADINASATSDWEGSVDGWTGLGRGTDFTGVFDGADFTISNLFIYAPGAKAGFFVDLDGTVKNLKLKTVDVTGGDITGGLVANLGGSVIDCSVTGTVDGGDSTGGVAGNMGGGAKIDSTTSSAVVTGDDDVGGLAGWGCEIVDSSASGTVTGVNEVGGLVGYNDCDEGVLRSSASGKVTGTSTVGGLEGVGNGPVVKSFATGDVEASSSKAGGIAGENWRAITDAYAKGDVTANSIAGGIAGYNQGATAIITRAYATGDTVATTDAGGLAGDGSGTAVSSYWDKSGGLSISNGGGTGVLTAALKNQSTFSGWDFVSTWQINEGISTPTFRWQSEGGDGGDGGDGEVTKAPGVNLGCFLDALAR